MIAAPSCSGAFLKKILRISGVETFASSAMPPSAISRRSLCCPMTISAPVFVSDISRQAVTIGTTLVCTASSPVEKMRVMKLKCFWRMPIICRKRRSSGWKTMISAMAPTEISCPRIVESSSMLSVRTTTHSR